MSDKRELKTLLSALLIYTLLFVGFVVAIYSRTDSDEIHSYGEIEEINVTVQPKGLDWGIIETNKTYSKILMIHNDGNIPMTVSMTTKDWTPINASKYVSYQWNKENAIIDAGGNLTALIFIFVKSEMQNEYENMTQFSNIIVITGTG